MLREILSQPQGAREEIGDSEGLNDSRHGSKDSGYFSRRNSKAISAGDGRRDSVFMEELGEMAEGIERDDGKDEDEGAEEADDEGVGLESSGEFGKEVEENEGGEKQEGVNVKGDEDQGKNDDMRHPTDQTETALTPEHVRQPYPLTRIGTRFISARKPAEPRVSADEAVVARPRYPGMEK